MKDLKKELREGWSKVSLSRAEHGGQTGMSDRQGRQLLGEWETMMSSGRDALQFNTYRD